MARSPARSVIDLLSGWDHQHDRLNRKLQLHPAGHTSLERSHASNAAASEPERLTGAGGFVWSGAVQAQVPIAGNLGQVRVELLGWDPPAPGNGIGHGGNVERRSQIDDRNVLSGIEHPLETLPRGPRNTQRAR